MYKSKSFPLITFFLPQNVGFSIFLGGNSYKCVLFLNFHFSDFVVSPLTLGSGTDSLPGGSMNVFFQKKLIVKMILNEFRRGMRSSVAGIEVMITASGGVGWGSYNYNFELSAFYNIR